VFDSHGIKPADDLRPDAHVDRRLEGSATDLLPVDQPGDIASPCGTPCPLGCLAAQKRCYRLDPSNFDVSSFHDQVTKGVTASGTLVFDTDGGAVSNGATMIRPGAYEGTVYNGIYFGVVQQGSGYPALAVFGLTSLAVPAGQTLAIRGERPLAIYATGDVTIEGTVSATPPAAPLAAPGGFAGGSTGDAPACLGGEGKGGELSYLDEGGGGGGGRKAAGGGGGSDSAGTQGGAGGVANGAATLVPLYGGCGGGHGGHSCSGAGGGGGGAIQISASGTISVTGVVSMPGAGGGDGEYGTFSCSGGGGGSGGAILLEAAAITIASSAVLAANGGGGGGYAAGEVGLASTANAAGGATNSKTGKGGAGGAKNPEAGAPGDPGNAGGGGGGGGAGLIRLSSAGLKLQSSSVSPAPSTSSTVGVW
jgi:hypothetical protein